MHAMHDGVPRLAGDVARRAFDAATRIAHAASRAELDAVFAPTIRTLGFVNYVSVETRGRSLRLIDGRPHTVWFPHLVASGYQWADAPFVAAQEGSAAVFYSDVEKLRDLTPEQVRIAHERREHGVLDGFANSVHAPDGVVFTVAMIGADIDPRDPDVRAAAHILSTYYGLASRRLEASAAPPAPAVALTRRQIDCLSWVREGKSATDIGAILGISAHTVHEHVAAACARLGVRTRIQAVAAAMALRLIDP
ncbi:MAG: LuxR C-terminal-related transcriptional regulator [Hyphomonadaceae bacterium]|nr:LuxR C-terminal-related transcriptional regulator [Hyphomonadaceae bacterium]